MSDFTKLIARLQKHYGAPELPPARGAFELVLWENACYLLPDHRRAAVFEGLRAQVGLTPDAILNAPARGAVAAGNAWAECVPRRGSSAGRRSRASRRISSKAIWSRSWSGRTPRAKKALKLFPSIGDPGAEKILMFCGVAEGLPLESNGLRVLTRIGYGRAQLKNYGAMYRACRRPSRRNCPKARSGWPAPICCCARTARRSAATPSRSATNARSRMDAPSAQKQLS